jgi:predicted alpha/beta-hydrolase family hydrolase
VSLRESFAAAADPPVRGFLERPDEQVFTAVLTHGAGSDARARTLVAMSAELAARGGLVLVCDLPYRQARPSGPPRPHEAARDREGLRRAAEAVRNMAAGPLLLGGHSYGGRQASMLAADDPTTAGALLLMSYPLHPPGKPETPRTAHLGSLRMPCLFVHGARDPFGSIDEMREALSAVPRAELIIVEGAGHDLRKLDAAAVAARVLDLLQLRNPAS